MSYGYVTRAVRQANAGRGRNVGGFGVRGETGPGEFAAPVRLSVGVSVSQPHRVPVCYFIRPGRGMQVQTGEIPSPAAMSARLVTPYAGDAPLDR